MYADARKSTRQLIRYILIGLSANTMGYLLYLLFTNGLGGEPKTVMTLLYILSVVATFLLNRSLTFTHSGDVYQAFRKYLLTYGIGYFINLAGLVLAVDILGYKHYIAQAVLIVIVAAILFLIQRYWVFRNTQSQ